MNYNKIYNSLINKRKIDVPQGYVERHHIIPKSLGGSDRSDNLVYLTAREHFVAHLLLVKIYENTQNYHKMLKAFFMMLVCESENQKRYITSRKFEVMRKEYAIAKSIEQSGVRNSQYGTCWITHELFGKKKIKKELIEEYIFQGWYCGATFKYVKPKKSKEEKYLKRKEKREIMYPDLDTWYKLYSEKGFDKFVKQTGYKYSQANLVTLFSKYVDSFVPQNGKKRTT
jgi:5-methylcytosine-specific restriction endonuclease McrA